MYIIHIYVIDTYVHPFICFYTHIYYFCPHLHDRLVGGDDDVEPVLDLALRRGLGPVVRQNDFARVGASVKKNHVRVSPRLGLQENTGGGVRVTPCCLGHSDDSYAENWEYERVGASVKQDHVRVGPCLGLERECRRGNRNCRF